MTLCGATSLFLNSHLIGFKFSSCSFLESYLLDGTNLVREHYLSINVMTSPSGCDGDWDEIVAGCGSAACFEPCCTDNTSSCFGAGSKNYGVASEGGRAGGGAGSPGSLAAGGGNRASSSISCCPAKKKPPTPLCSWFTTSCQQLQLVKKSFYIKPKHFISY